MLKYKFQLLLQSLESFPHNGINKDLLSLLPSSLLPPTLFFFFVLITLRFWFFKVAALVGITVGAFYIPDRPFTYCKVFQLDQYHKDVNRAQ